MEQLKIQPILEPAISKTELCSGDLIEILLDETGALKGRTLGSHRRVMSYVKNGQWKGRPGG